MGSCITEQEVSREDREFVRGELAWLANKIREKYGLSIPKIRRFIREMLDVSV